jgi:hypothetical protein
MRFLGKRPFFINDENPALRGGDESLRARTAVANVSRIAAILSAALQFY